MKGYINGKEVEFNENDTILATARAHGHFIPTLCALTCLNHTPRYLPGLSRRYQTKRQQGSSYCDKLRYSDGRRYGSPYKD